MEGSGSNLLKSYAEVFRHRSVLFTCMLATCARNTEPPLWIFRPPPSDAFNQASNTFNLATGLFSLSLLALILIGGVLGDLSGRRRMLLIGLGGLVVSNLLSLLSPSVSWFIFTRILAGAFGALVVPISLSILYLTFAGNPETRKRAIGVFVLVTTTALLLSGVLGMLAYQTLGWRAPLVLPTVLAIGALIMVLRTTTESQVHVERRVDVIVYTAWALVVLSGMGSLIAWMSSGRYATLGLFLALGGLVLGIGLLIWWDWRKRGTGAGLPQIKLRELTVLILFGLAMQFGFVGFVQQLRNVMLGVYGYTPVLATIALAPLLIGMLLMTLYADRQLRNAKARPLMAGGLLVGAAICTLTALTQAAGFYPWLAILLSTFGAGMIMATITWTTVFLVAVPEDVIGVRTGINSAVFQMGGTLGSLFPAALLVEFGSTAYNRILAAAGVPPDQIEEAIQALNLLLDPTPYNEAIAPEIASQLIAGYEIAYLDAYSSVLMIIAVVCVFGAATVWFGLKRRQEAGSMDLVKEHAP